MTSAYFRPSTYMPVHTKKDPQRIKKSDREVLLDLDYDGIEFPISIKDYAKLQWKDTRNEEVLNLLLITEGKKKHNVLIKDSNSLLYNKTKHKERKHFWVHCLQCFSTEEILSNYKTNCMVINGQQSIRMPQKGNNMLQFQNYPRKMRYHM
ncbi:unnamed protein product [Porites lobata]|uniref:Uncharacterized protein n=1 Tax=Porites lobata TaxID=104759 RepID=A0ABN8SET7_9CNID|nr:unnamed protein product [Porites lobata]